MLGRRVRAQRDQSAHREQTQQQGDCEGGRGKGDDYAGDNQRLGYRIRRKSRRCAFARNDAEHEEDATAQQIEADNLAQWIGIDQQAVKTQADERRARQSREGRCSHGNGRSTGSRVGGPTTSRGSVAATESTMKASINRISGLASPAG